MIRRIQPREYLKRFLDNNVRPDGRTLTMARDMVMTTGSINTAVGSAMVKIGRTMAVAGVEATLEEPSASSPEDGVIDYTVEILATASFNFRQIRASDDALVLTHYIRQWLEPHIDLSSLCVEPSRLVWHLRLTAYCIDNDGNMDDALLLAAVGALKNVMLPTVTMTLDYEEGDDDKDMVDGSGSLRNDGRDSVAANRSVIAEASPERTNPLQLDSFPLAVSFALFDDKAFIDPSVEEEASADSRLTFLLHPNGDLRAVLKPGGKKLSKDVYEYCLAQAKLRAATLVQKLTGT